jgi:hypothetical protein
VAVTVTVTGTVSRPLTLTAPVESETPVRTGVTTPARGAGGEAATGSGKATTAAAAASRIVVRRITFP